MAQVLVAGAPRTACAFLARADDCPLIANTGGLGRVYCSELPPQCVIDLPHMSKIS